MRLSSWRGDPVTKAPALGGCGGSGYMGL